MKEDNNVVYQLSDIKETSNKNFSPANFGKINDDNDNNNTQSKKAAWWLNELDSLGIKKSNYDKNESKYIQNLENLCDSIKQGLIRDYRIC